LPSDIRALGRLGDAMRGSTGRRRRRSRISIRRDSGAYVARRRGRVPRPVLWGLAVAALVVLWVGFAASRQAEQVPVAAAGAQEQVQPVPERPVAAEGDRASRSEERALPAAASQAFAAIGALQLVLPHPQPLTVAFHEASRPEALALQPIGRLAGNDNPTKFSAPADVDGPDYRILSSRGRARPATSAVDVAVPASSIVAAPVSGTVVEVREYALYGKIRDWRVVIEAADRPDLHVVLVHLHEPQVAVGDVVTAGQTPLAVVRQLPFASHVDYVTDDPHPHTHIEVKPGTAAEPLDPNAPAVSADEGD
jgi:murein DD-endopeptidase MepM/ murein hydrolase activator NlpD